MYFFILFFLSLTAALKGEFINRAVVNIYLSPQEDTEVDSQAIYGSSVELVEKKDDWAKIKMADGLEGWLPFSQLTTKPSYEKSKHLRSVKRLFAHVYRVANITLYPPLLTIPYGAKVKIDETRSINERWLPIELLSGEKAWIQRADVEISLKRKTLEEILFLSKKFLGLPYTWGGASSYGYDCSGFIQMLFKEMGVQLPRNASQQAESNLLMTVAPKNLQPGDLLFFGEKKVTHVGLYLGSDEYIHSGARGEFPGLKINNIKDGTYSFLLAKRLRSQEVTAPSPKGEGF